MWQLALNAFNSLDEKSLTIISIGASVIGAALSLVVAVLGVWFAVAQYRLKRSIKIGATWGYSQSAFFNDGYVNSVTIKNLKDKTEAIFGIHLRLGHNVYITLDELETSPLTLLPFETITRTYKPVTFYGCNSHKVNLNKAFKSNRRKAAIVLSTSQGRYVTESLRMHWQPVMESLSNYNVAALQCVQVKDKKPNGQEFIIPSTTQYIVRYTQNNDRMSSDITRAGPWFSYNHKCFNLEPKHLESTDILETHLKSLSTLESQEGIDLSSIEVLNVSELSEMKRMNEHYTQEGELKPSGWFITRVIGKILYFVSHYRMNRSNHDRRNEYYSYNEELLLDFIFITLFSTLTIIAIGNEILLIITDV